MGSALKDKERQGDGEVSLKPEGRKAKKGSHGRGWRDHKPEGLLHSEATPGLWRAQSGGPTLTWPLHGSLGTGWGLGEPPRLCSSQRGDLLPKPWSLPREEHPCKWGVMAFRRVTGVHRADVSAFLLTPSAPSL